MREIVGELRSWVESGQRIALGTLVHVQKSAPRLPGAHCAVSESDAITGAISAGCVESDLIEWSRDVLAVERPKLLAYDVADADAMRVGLTCGGAIEVLVEPLAAHTVAWSKVLAAVDHDLPVGLAVAVSPERLLGRRMFLVEDVIGSIDPAIDAAVEGAMRDQLVAGGSRNFEIELAGETVRVFVEAIAPPPRLVVVGATQTAIPLCRMAKELDFHVTVVDPREVYSSEERLAAADRVVREWPEAAFARVRLDDNSYVVVLTHDAKFDLPSLRIALRSDARYIGALGSRRTHAKRVDQLRSEGFDDDQLARIHAPIGLDLGGRAPAEIALAILAEVTAARFGRDPRGAGARDQGSGARG
jgi:xanthine dehydrogenase accessory factor